MGTAADIQRSLGDLVEAAAGVVRVVSAPAGVTVTSIEHDSRRVVPGSLFVAVPGLQSDGHSFIETAVRQGAKAILCAGERAGEFGALGDRGIAILASDDPRRALSILAAAFHGFPSRAMSVVGITGTNGKTSITYLLEAIALAAGRKPGVIGTVNYRWAGKELPAPNTTPESRELQELLAAMRADGVDLAIMEVSSHALDLCRVDDIDFDAAVFTNLTRDHLDYHKNFEEYFAAKRKLFSLLGRSPKSRRTGVVNADDEYGRALLAARGEFGYPVVSFGMAGDADYRPAGASVESTIRGIGYTMEQPHGGERIALRLSGNFQIYNSLAAIAAAEAIGIPFDAIRAGLAGLDTVPGRFSVVQSDAGFGVVVDYAHTSDALEKLLASVRELGPARLITVFGCGGDRDRTKRPLMGGIAEELSDRIIVTSDNPRTEEPNAIIEDVLRGLKRREAAEVIADREQAIRRAIELGGEGDIIVIAGKGHEDYQIIGKTKTHFDDREIAAKYIRERRRG